MKVAEDFPVHKKGRTSNMKKYRSVSIICNPNKILETMIFSRMKTLFAFQFLLSNSRFGICEYKYTELEIMTQ